MTSKFRRCVLDTTNVCNKLYCLVKVATVKCMIAIIINEKSRTQTINKQLLNEVEQDMRNYYGTDLNNSSFPTRTEFNNCLIIQLYIIQYIGLRVNAWLALHKRTRKLLSHLYFPAVGISSINQCDVIRSYMCFQYSMVMS